MRARMHGRAAVPTKAGGRIYGREQAVVDSWIVNWWGCTGS